MEENIQDLIDKLSPIERKIIPFLNLKIEEMEKKQGLDKTTILRALSFLENKNIIKIKTEKKVIIDLGTNGIYYKKNHLPERKLITVLEDKNHLPLEEAKKISGLSENEFKVSLGVLKNKAIINLKNGKISLQASKEEIVKKWPEEQFIESLPREKSSLAEEDLYSLNLLEKRKDIIETHEKKEIFWELTEIGKKLEGKSLESNLLEEVTPEIIANWNKNKKFRKYDLQTNVPKIYGGKKHFVNQSIEYAKKIWTDMGFKEMSGPIVDTSFWIFDALFTPQDHPAREMQDTFFIKNKTGKLPSKDIVDNVKKAHESGVQGSKGWNYQWKEEEAKKLVLRTHTTGISARTLSELKESDLPAKYFTIGKVFRNETVDWSHEFEFYQTEGIVVDKEANFKNLLGYLKEFYKKMGFEKIKFVPSFFAYTEPSVEIQVFHPVKKIWFELGGAGMLRPEVVIPLLGKNIPVLAWGQGFERIIMDHYKIEDLREMYSNDIGQLREKKFWIK